ncbi:MAG: hypothetical protein WA364_13175, partial [Candidatus Nitrosopolaris sp.]
QGQYQHHQQSLEEQERYHLQQQVQSLSPSPAAIQDQPPDVLSYPTDPTFQPQPAHVTTDEQTTTLAHRGMVFGYNKIPYTSLEKKNSDFMDGYNQGLEERNDIGFTNATIPAHTDDNYRSYFVGYHDGTEYMIPILIY